MAVSVTPRGSWLRRVGECLAVMVVCVGCSYLFAVPAAGWLARVGIIRNFGLAHLPTTILSPADAKLIALLGAVSAGNSMGILLYWLPQFPLISLLGLSFPWGLCAAYASLLTDLEGVWYRGVLSGLGYLTLALGQWLVCLIAYRLTLRAIRRRVTP